MRVLLAEDDAQIGEGVVHGLRKAGFAVDWVRNGSEADTALNGDGFDVLVLDLGLPVMSGLEVLKRLRARHSPIPVMILTALDGVHDRVKGLDLGADDYLVKPFALEELEARVRALSRRSQGAGSALLHHGPLELDQVGKVARVNGAPLELSARELGLLEMLLLRAGRNVSKDQLVDHLCEWGEEVSANAIEVYVHRLRKKLHPAGVDIVTVRGLGYRIEKVAARS